MSSAICFNFNQSKNLLSENKPWKLQTNPTKKSFDLKIVPKEEQFLGFSLTESLTKTDIVDQESDCIF